ncbi:SCO family protein [Lacibacterium aquatile]|uniref:SCO family protein n=1 Tax=Lacibacterium aquatile TaxID=1168082 RepID=A0ABW5DVQ9_9PROT
MTPQRFKAIIISCLAIAALGIGAIVAILFAKEDGPLSASDKGSFGAPAIGGAFELVNQDGKTVTDKDYRGRFMLIYFGYSFCPDVCPTALSVMADALDQLPEPQRAKVAPLFITIDPERDTVALMKEYVPQFYPTLEGLTGTPVQTAAAAKAYRSYFKKNEATKTQENYLMDHSSIVYLMGPDGRFITNFTHETTPERMAAKLKEVTG